MDHHHPDITAPEGGAGGEPLEGAVRDRILRLHPQAGDGGLSGTVMRKSAGWDQAGTFAAEIMSRFRSPFEVPSTAMPLALPVAESRTPASGSAPVSETPSPVSPVSLRPLPVVGSVPSGKLGAGGFVQRKVMRGSDSTPSIQAAGTVAAQFSAPEKLAEGFHKSSVASDNYESKADVSPQPLSPPTAAGTWAMTARLHRTLGARLVQRHSAFAGPSTEKEAGEGSPFPVPGMPLASGETTPLSRGNETIGRTVHRQASGITESGKSMADKVSPETPAVGAASRVRPPFLKQQREGVSTSPKTAVVQLRPEPPATAQPPVKTTPSAGATLQRKGGAASLTDDIFSRLPNPSSGAATQSLPLALPGVAPFEASKTPRFDEASASAFSAASAVAPFPQGARRDGDVSGETPLPVIQQALPGGGASGVVSRKTKDTVMGPELSRRSTPAGVSGTAGAVFYPRNDQRSPPLPSVPAPPSGPSFSSLLPLARMRDAGGNIQRKLSDSLPVAQRSETTGSSSTATPAGGTSESAAAFSPSGSSTANNATVAPGATIDLERVADEVYRIIERRLIVEKENRGL